MSSFLNTIIITGPSTLRVTKEFRDELSRVISEVRQAEALERDPSHFEIDECPKTHSHLNWIYAAAKDNSMGVLHLCSTLLAELYLPERFIRNLILFWNGAFHDSSSRVSPEDPTRKIFVVGDYTDEWPDGPAYSLVYALLLTPLAEKLGIR